MEYREIICACCGKKVGIPIDPKSRNFDFNYSILINSYDEFFDMVDMCPECGYVFLFDTDGWVDDDMREYISSSEYRDILNNPNLESGLKKWILYAILQEHVDAFTVAGIAYMKAYDYLELKNMELDKRLIEKSASCFLSAEEKKLSFTDGLLAVDALRRDGDFERATHILKHLSGMFEGKIVDKNVEDEKMWIILKETAKRILDI